MFNEIIIWGANSLGRYTANNLFEQGKQIIAIIDNNPVLQQDSSIRFKVIPENKLSHFICKKCNTILLAAKSAKNIIPILKSLNKYPVENIGFIKARSEELGRTIRISEDEIKGGIVWYRYKGKETRVIPYIELNVIDSCNLNCRACTHFSSLFHSKIPYSFNIYKKDLMNSRKIGKILRLRLLGGEPLLVRNVEQYIQTAREIFPEAEIEVVTNGLLISKISNSLVNCMRENEVSFDITLYPPTVKMRKEIEAFLKQKNIQYFFSKEEVHEFKKNLTLCADNRAEESSKACTSATCAFLRNGRIYKCPVAGLIEQFYKKYCLEYSGIEQGIEIEQMNTEKVFDDLIKQYVNPINLCKFCTDKIEVIPWKTDTDPLLESWIVKG